MAKVDIRSAYLLIPVHPSDQLVLGVLWKGKLYVDSQLPFGLRSAPKIFTAIADAIEWCVRLRGVSFVAHYLDDFITFGPPDSPVCGRNLALLSEECTCLGAALADEKSEGPTTLLPFLGIEIDTVEATLRLPPEKLQRLQRMTAEWQHRKSCKKRELESLIGVLQYACKVIRPGRSFLRHMIALLSSVRSEYHHIRLNSQFRSDLAWWKSFAAQWNGVSLIMDSEHITPVPLVTDASGSWGAGGWSGKQWFQMRWPQSALQQPIAAQELIPIVVALALWGHAWSRRRVLCYCDNQAAVAAIRSRYSRHPLMANLLRCMFFFEAKYSCTLAATHIPGVLNDRADDLSRNRADLFLSKVPEANPLPTSIPPVLLDLLLDPTADWTSPHWMQRFESCLTTV